MKLGREYNDIIAMLLSLFYGWLSPIINNPISDYGVLYSQSFLLIRVVFTMVGIGGIRVTSRWRWGHHKSLNRLQSAMVVFQANSFSTTTISAQSKLESIRKSVSQSPPASFMLQNQHRLIPLDGNQLWEEVKYKNIKQEDCTEDTWNYRNNYFNHTSRILPYMTGDSYKYELLSEHIERVPHEVEWNTRSFVPKPDTTVLTIEDFYRNELLQCSSHSTETTAPYASRAIIVPFEYLTHLTTLFPNIQINRFEYSEDFYYGIYDWGTFKPRFHYNKVIDMCQDKAVWSSNMTTPVMTESFTIDVIVHCKRYSSVEARIMEKLLEQLYKHDVRPLKSPIFVLSPLYEFTLHRLPLCGGGMPIAKLKQCADEVERVLLKLKDTFHACGWFQGTPQIKIVNFHTDPDQDNVLCEPGTEHLYPLSVSSNQVADWIFDGSVASGKVLLRKSRFDLDRDLNQSIDCRLNSYDELFDSKAEVVVFYCNNASSNSPRDVQAYHKWLRANHPDSKQRSALLVNGVNGLHAYLKRAKYSEEDMLKVFAEKYHDWDSKW